MDSGDGSSLLWEPGILGESEFGRISFSLLYHILCEGYVAAELNDINSSKLMNQRETHQDSKHS